MSDIVLAKQGIDPRVIDMANQIKAEQEPEIQQLQTWLSQWGHAPTSGTATPGTTMPGMPHGSAPGMSAMDGMISEQDMQALQNAQGGDASRLFLNQMIQHHQGAITMAQKMTKAGQYPPAIALAQKIVTDQQQEISSMQTILSSL